MSDTREYKDHHLSRIYREGAWPEPSRQIDQAILAASRRAAREQLSFARRWAPSFAVAATVVLASTLALKVYQEQPEVVSPSVAEKVQAPRAPTSPASESKATETKPATLPDSQPVATPRGFSSTMDTAEAERLERMQRDLGAKQGLPASESSQAAQKAPAALKKEAAEPGRAADALQRRPDLQQNLRARESPQPPAGAPVSVFGAPPSSPAPQSPRAAAKPATPFTQNAPVPARLEPVQPQAVEADRLQATLQAAPPAPSPTVSEAAPASQVANSIAGTRSAGALVAGGATKTPERSPQTWIADIRKLMAAGKSEEAGSELAEFKKRYPAFVLPEDLR